jgi:pimeloyl-ACP methyl ester carboxylesterase
LARPRLLLCPQFTEVEWAIAPQLSEWADVATFDAPGVGDEPLPGDDPSRLTREHVVGRAMEELERRDWDSDFVVGDAWGTATAARVALANPEPVLGIALGHASLNYVTEGERPAVIGEIAAAMTQLMRTDYDSFVRYGLTQLTQGGFDEEMAGRMVARFPDMHVAAKVWEIHVNNAEPVGDLLAEVDKPLLLAKHDGCLAFTGEGFDDAVAAFPDAHTAVIKTASGASDEFAAALRDFCGAVMGES